MHYSSLLPLGAPTLAKFLGSSSALGIECCVSALCALTIMSSSHGKLLQILRDVVWAANGPHMKTALTGLFLCSSFFNHIFQFGARHANTEPSKSLVVVR